MCKILVRGKKRKKGIKEGTGREAKEGKKEKSPDKALWEKELPKMWFDSFCVDCWAWDLCLKVVWMLSKKNNREWFPIGDCFWLRDRGLSPLSLSQWIPSDYDRCRPCASCHGLCEFILCQYCCIWKALFLWHPQFPLALTIFLLPFLYRAPWALGQWDLTRHPI